MPDISYDIGNIHFIFKVLFALRKQILMFSRLAIAKKLSPFWICKSYNFVFLKFFFQKMLDILIMMINFIKLLRLFEKVWSASKE